MSNPHPTPGDEPAGSSAAAEAGPASVSDEQAPVTLEQALRAAQNMQRHGDLEPAEAVYIRILEVLPQEPNALHFLGVLRHQQGRHSEALELIRRAIEHVPQDAGPWINLGNVLLQTQAFDEAVDAYKRAAELAPNNLLVFNNLGLLHSRRHNPALAEAVFKHALGLAPDAEYVLHNYARLLLSQERFEESIGYGLKVLTRSPDHPRARRLLATSHTLLGDHESARQVLEEWLTLSPGHVEAEHFLAALGARPVPSRASDAYVQSEFDEFSKSFDAKLSSLGYQAPALVTQALRRALGLGEAGQAQPPLARVLDAGCGTGLCAAGLRPLCDQLEGVDLSEGMLKQARARGGYDTLVQAELCAHLAAHPGRWNAVISADTLCYFGALEEAAQAAFAALQPGGVLVFSVEAAPEGVPCHALQYHGRYHHAAGYLRQVLADAGFAGLELVPGVLRQELMRPVQGWIVVGHRPPKEGERA